jgi:hypothetical protein
MADRPPLRFRTVRAEGADCPWDPEKPKSSLDVLIFITDCPTWTLRLSAAEPWLTVELAGGGSDLGFGWGLFLWVSRSV